MRPIRNVSVAFHTEKGNAVEAQTDLKVLSVGKAKYDLTEVPSRHGAEYWTRNPAVKVISLINGNVVWWLPSIEQLIEQGGNANG